MHMTLMSPIGVQRKIFDTSMIIEILQNKIDVFDTSFLKTKY